MAAPIAGSSSMACVFLEYHKGFRSGMNVTIVARAAEIFDLAPEEEAAAETEAAPAALPVQQGTKLYVRNMPWTCDSAQLAEICHDIGVVEAVEVIYDQESVERRGGSGEGGREWWDKSDRHKQLRRQQSHNGDHHEVSSEVSAHPRMFGFKDSTSPAQRKCLICQYAALPNSISTLKGSYTCWDNRLSP